MKTQKLLKLLMSASITAGMVMSVSPVFASEIESESEQGDEIEGYDIVPEEDEEDIEEETEEQEEIIEESEDVADDTQDSEEQEPEEDYSIMPLIVEDSDVCEIIVDGEEHGFATLQDAIHFGGEEETTIILLSDIAESVVIPADRTIVIDLNGHTITDDGAESSEEQTGSYKATIVNEGTLTIIGDGTIDVTTDGCAALSNDIGAVCTIEGGTFTRSLEGDGNTYYTVCNQGTMTINGGTFENDGVSSSMIENGFYNGSEEDPDGSSAVLTINGGSFTGGLYNVKSDDYSKLVINDGTFTAAEGTSGGCILVWNDVTINGGTFFSDDVIIVEGGPSKDSADSDNGKISITGGLFTSNSGTIFALAEGGVDMSGVSVSGGTFVDGEGLRASVVAYLKSGYGQNKEGEVVLSSEIIVSKITLESDTAGTFVIRIYANGELKDSYKANISPGTTDVEVGTYNMLDDNGDDVEYTLSIDPVDGFEIEQDGFNFVISPVVTSVDIAGSIFWSSDIYDGAVTVRLFAGEEEISSTDVTGDTSEWRYSFDSLDKYDSEGNEIEYAVSIDEVEGFEIEQDGFNFIIDAVDSDYEYTVVSGSITWTSTIEDCAVLNLYANGDFIGSTILDSSYASEDDEHIWNYMGVFDMFDSDGNVIEYTVSLDEIVGYTIEQDGYDFIITPEEVEKITVGGTITWTDGTPLDGTIRLYMDGEEHQSMSFTASENIGSYSFTNCPKYDSDGNEIIYTTSMDEIDGYEITQDGYDFTITKTSDDTDSGTDGDGGSTTGTDSNDGDGTTDSGTDSGSTTSDSDDGTTTTSDTGTTSVTGTVVPEETDGSYEPTTVITTETVTEPVDTVGTDVEGSVSASTGDTNIVPIAATIVAVAAAAIVIVAVSVVRRKRA